MKKKLAIALMILLAIIFVYGVTVIQRPQVADATTQASKKSTQQTPPSAQPQAPDKNYVSVSFPFNRQNAKGTDQFAIWIENEQGQFIRTVFVTQYGANKGVKKSNIVPTWVDKSGARNSGKVDSAAGATPDKGTVTYYWDLKDQNGNTVQPGQYRVLMETTQDAQHQLEYSGTIQIGGSETTTTLSPSANGERPASLLTEDVTVHYQP